jgi:hypothetical protein
MVAAVVGSSAAHAGHEHGHDVRTDWAADPNAKLVIDAINLQDGSRPPAALTLKTQEAAVRITR